MYAVVDAGCRAAIADAVDRCVRSAPPPCGPPDIFRAACFLRGGTPHWVLLTSRLGGVEHCFLVERTGVRPGMWMLMLRFDPELYRGDGTLFDADLTPTSVADPGTGGKRHRIVANDVLCVGGAPVGRASLTSRIAAIDDILSDRWYADPWVDVADLCVARYFPSIDVASAGFGLYRAQLEKTRDVTVACFRSTGHRGAEMCCAFSAARGHGGKVFQLRRTSMPDTYEVVEHGVVVGAACIDTAKRSKKMREMFRDAEVADVRCVYLEKFRAWAPVV